MRRKYIFGMLTSLLISGCAEKSTGNNDAIAENENTGATTELTSCDITLGNLKFDKAKNTEAGAISIENDTLKFTAGPQTDYFRSPDGNVTDTSPVIFTEVSLVDKATSDFRNGKLPEE